MKTKIKLAKVLFYTFVVLGIVILMVSLALGDSRHSNFFYGTIASIPLLFFSAFLHFRIGKLKKLEQIRLQWGKPLERKRDFEEIGQYHRFNPTLVNKTLIDDDTWHDLNMNDLFSRIDRTLTCPGESVLYQLLRNLCLPESFQELQHRDKIISIMQKQPRTREALQMALLKMGWDRDNSITHLLWGKLPDRSPFAFLYSLLALAALLVLIAPVFLGATGISLIFAVFSVNSLVHYRVRKKYSYHIPSLSYLASLLRSAHSIAQAGLPGLEKEQHQLRDALDSTKKIGRQVRSLFMDSGSTSDLFFLVQYIQILFLVEVRSFYGALKEIEGQIEVLRTIYAAIGLLDALQAVASYREGLDYIKPEFTAQRCLKAINIRHPLLNTPVSNSIEIRDQGILITGSNMAGKSTFLRTLGVNAVLAQSLCTCLAQTYKASFLQISTSINKMDNISQEKSLYFAEAERLLHLIRPDSDKIPALILIDELLSGTNYTERLAASAAILNYLKDRNALVVVATHDLDLAENLGTAFQYYHFSDKVDKNNLDFDYSLKKGIATSRNAIKLLEHLGFPEEITQLANQLIN